jgi:hypothetical protein
MRRSIDIKQVGVYGRSLGGFVALQNAQLTDFVIVDRSFSNISMISKKKFNGTIQLLFDIFVRHLPRFDNILNSKESISIIFDPNVS